MSIYTCLISHNTSHIKKPHTLISTSNNYDNCLTDQSVQVFLVAMVNNFVPENCPHSGGVKVNIQAEERPFVQEDIFIMEGGGAPVDGTMQTAKEVIDPLCWIPICISTSLQQQVFLMSSLPYQAGYTILHHLGIVNLFLIRESTSIKEVI